MLWINTLKPEHPWTFSSSKSIPEFCSLGFSLINKITVTGENELWSNLYYAVYVPCKAPNDCQRWLSVVRSKMLPLIAWPFHFPTRSTRKQQDDPHEKQHTKRVIVALSYIRFILFNTGDGKQQTFWFCCLNTSSNLENSTHHFVYSRLHPII